MENLQTEVQEMEFIQFSKGMNFMRKEDFAEWLLCFTHEENNEIYWNNVKERIQAGEVYYFCFVPYFKFKCKILVMKLNQKCASWQTEKLLSLF